ncbi:MAG: helix-turn-helix transcriptional regulator [Acidobacteriota bacterium]|nr:helix-turn-helix transcriptional regulator [Acidobacteriota bacterium]
MSEFKGIGKALKLLRSRGGLKQKELAERAGITPAMISNYETEKAMPQIPTVESLLEALGNNRFDLLNALEEVNERPLRDLSEVGDRTNETKILEVLGVRSATVNEEEHYMQVLEAVCRLVELARRP